MGFDPVIFTSSALISSLVFIAYEGRPRGGLQIDSDLLEVRQSSVKDAGVGLFARQDLPAETCLGSYPGRLWPAGIWLRFKGATIWDAAQTTSRERELRQIKARSYVWKLENGNIIDPTTSDGELPEFVGSEVSTMLCRINEPSSGFDTNVITAEMGDELVFKVTSPLGVCNEILPSWRVQRPFLTWCLNFKLERDVRQGEELFLDYGPFYDRTGYSSGSFGTLMFPDE
eukprot:1429299-Rhodomonas_salina.1